MTFTMGLNLKHFLFLPLIFIISSLVLAASNPLERDLPVLEVLPKASSQWIAEKMAVNGLLMSVREFKYTGREEDVKRFYVTRWRTKGHGKTTEQRLGFDTILGYELRGYYYSVQYYQKGDVVVGKLAVSELPKARRVSKQKTDFPLPPNSRLLKKIEYLDQGRRSETLTIRAARSVNSAAEYVANQLENGGWIQSAGGVENSSLKVHYKQIQYQRGAERLQVTFYPQAGNKRKTEILVNWINK